MPRLLRKQSQAQMPTHKHTQKTQRSCDMSIIIRKLTTSTIINYNNSNNILQMEEDNDTVMLLKGDNDREMVVLYYFSKFHSIGAASPILVLCIN